MTKGTETRATILEQAAMLASVDGLEQVSLARVADAVGMSKSGLFAHFRSKQQLQFGTIDAAAAIYVREVVEPALAEAKGLPRLLAMCRSFLSHVERDVFPGGCFFAAAAVEYDARTGPVRDRVAARQEWWLETLERLASDAVTMGHVVGGADAAQMAFELESFMFTANNLHKLNPRRAALKRADAAIVEMLGRLATPKGRRAAGLRPKGAVRANP